MLDFVQTPLTGACVASSDERGASAVEYSLLAAGIAALVVGAVVLLGGATLGLFEDSCDEIAAEMTVACEG